MIAPEIARTLRAIDWDFATPRSGYSPPPHWYPGTFVPALSDALIEALTPKGAHVFDPYSGIGTTAWSAIRMGRTSTIADVNPVALLVGYVTTSLLALARSKPAMARGAIGAVGRLIGRNEDLFGGLTVEANEDRIEAAIASISSPAPAELLTSLVAAETNWDALKPWIAPETLSEIRAALKSIDRSGSPFLRLLGLCMVSAVARSVCSQHASWGHIADNVRPRELKTQSLHAATSRWLRRAMTFVAQPMLPSANEKEAETRVKVVKRNWSAPGNEGPGSADLLLTSPPYADAIDYTLSQRLSLYLLGYDDDAVLRLVAEEIGARRKRFKSVSRTQWSAQLCGALKEQVTWLKPTGTICLVLPHKDSGRSVGEDGLKASLLEDGWTIFFERDRSIHQSHTRQSWTSIKKETILAFSRGDL